MRSFMRILMGLLAALLIVSPAWAGDPPVTVIGTGLIQGGNITAAREMAIADALAAALDRVAGEILPPETLVKDFTHLNADLYSRPEPFIDAYKVLAEGAAGSLYRVRVEATVSADALRREFDKTTVTAAADPVPKPGLPRIMILMMEQQAPATGIAVSDMNATPAVAETALNRPLRNAGYTLVAPPPGPPGQWESSPDAITSLALSLGAQAQADIVVLATAAAEPSPASPDGSQRAAKGVVKTRALNVAGGAEIMAVNRNAVAMNPDDGVAAAEAMSTAATLVGEELAARLVTVWTPPAPPVAPEQTPAKPKGRLDVVVTGTQDLSASVKFRNTLSTLPGVKNVQVAEVLADQTVLAVDYDGPVETLAETLMFNTFEGFGVQIGEVTADRITITLVPGQG